MADPVNELEPGLYFLGLLFLYALSSDVLPGGGRDAEYVAKHIASRPGREAATLVEHPPLEAPAV